MDAKRFDTLARSIVRVSSRRAVLHGVGAAFGLVFAHVPWSGEAKKKRCLVRTEFFGIAGAGAKRKRLKKKRKKKKCPPPPFMGCQPQDQALTCGVNGCGAKIDNCGNSVACGACGSANSCVGGFCQCGGGAPCGMSQVCCQDLACKSFQGGVCMLAADCCSSVPVQYACMSSQCCRTLGSLCGSSEQCCSGNCNSSQECA